MTIPESAIKAAAQAISAQHPDALYATDEFLEIYTNDARAALQAALPAIRKQITAEIRAHTQTPDPAGPPLTPGVQAGMEYAAQIVLNTPPEENAP